MNTRNVAQPAPARPGRREVMRWTGGVALAGGLAACGSGAGSRPPGTISLAYTGDDATRLSYEGAAADFSAQNPGVTVEISTIPEGPVDAWLTTRTIAGQAPDIVDLGVAAVGRYSANGTAVDISDHLPAGYLDGYLPSLRALVERDGQVFGLPKTTGCMSMYYRRDVVDALGVSLPQSPDEAWTWAEFDEILREAKRFTGAYGLSYGFVNANSGNRWCPALYQRGGFLFDPETGEPGVGTEEGIDALEFFRTLYADEIISPSNTIKASQTDTAPSLFTSGQVGFMVHESQVLTLSQQLQDDEWGATYLFRDRETATTFSGSVHIVTSSSQEPELAARFTQFNLDRQHMIDLCRQSGFIVPFADVSPEEVGYATRPDDVAVSVEQFATVPDEVGVEMAGHDFQTVREVLGDNLDLLFIGSSSSREAAEMIDRGLRNA